MVPICVRLPMGLASSRRIASTPAMNVVVTAPIPTRRTPSLPLGSAIGAPFCNMVCSPIENLLNRTYRTYRTHRTSISPISPIGPIDDPGRVVGGGRKFLRDLAESCCRIALCGERGVGDKETRGRGDKGIRNFLLLVPLSPCLLVSHSPLPS